MTHRHEVETKFKGETLVRKGFMRKQDGTPSLRLVPDLNVVKIGGHGAIDYGREVVIRSWKRSENCRNSTKYWSSPVAG